MIIATVTTCPQRWRHYQRFRRNFESLGFPFILRTFQTFECQHNSYANNNLNARAALAYCDHHLPDDGNSWVLYLEDDVILGRELPGLLPYFIQAGRAENVDCWFLCNRKNRVVKQWKSEGLVLNELSFRPDGSHGLLIPKRHLAAILSLHWADLADRCIFMGMNHPGLKILQVVHPVLVEHVGAVSTYNPDLPPNLEINYAN
jgi:hypothetical protein